ncbi:hypothetical protein F2Q68_00001966 [Brassica cretica]|uniref:Uncharacterized protein n=1 Tax=Brassica cretica TaxID=69181 RepID=A0A8S9J643_BRACR|nr:hypothetical protein F2Q68_00001966 [Brassica cretica]
MLVKGLCFWLSYTLLDSFSDRVQGHPDGVVTKRRFGHIAPRLSGCALPELEALLVSHGFICRFKLSKAVEILRFLVFFGRTLRLEEVVRPGRW